MKKISSNEFVAHAEQVLRRIDMYERSGDAVLPKSNIKFMVQRIKQMKEAAATDRLSPKERRYLELTHLIVDGWPNGHSLGHAISNLEAEYSRL